LYSQGDRAVLKGLKFESAKRLDHMTVTYGECRKADPAL